jgi:hypothetical protein
MKPRAAAGVLCLAAVSLARAGIVSNNYVYKPEVVLRMKLDNGLGLQIDSVRFGTVRMVRARRTAAQVVVSSSRDDAVEAGVAVALYDSEGRLVGAAGAGPALVRGAQSRVFTVVFEGLDHGPDTATSFQISLESP